MAHFGERAGGRNTDTLGRRILAGELGMFRFQGREFAQQPDFSCVYQAGETQLADAADAPVLAAQDLVAP